MKKQGLERLIAATVNSKNGFKYLLRNEAAFRQELLLLVILSPIAVMIGSSVFESIALIGVIILVLIVEILNTAIEVAIDRIGVEQHELSGLAKDLGSAAVLLSLIFAGLFWFVVLIRLNI